MTTPSTADMSIFSVRSWGQLRAFLYVVVPVVLVALHVSHADLWISLVLAVLAPSLAAVTSVDGFRIWFYGVLAAAQAVILGLNIFTNAQISPWISVIGAVIGGGVAAANVNADAALPLAARRAARQAARRGALSLQRAA
ncbi:phage holin [Mycolicibacterium sphagni]|uniref:phage holin n=1 Tax=Mycolicibacterium sphagni TaxID=1786 RepID=UPI0021F25A1C|nr:hypothetical protein [Mycolicibacterium sphagni]MCV7174895.1 hypothetical protein [Mycolicibacterium sphagni]